MGCTGDDLDRLRCMQAGEGLFVQLDDAMISAADDKQCRGANLCEGFAREVRTASARDHCADPLGKLRRGEQGCGSAGAGSEQADRKASDCRRLHIEPLHGFDQPLREQLDVEDVGSVGLFFLGQQIEQERREIAVVRAFATARFRGLRWLDPLPCAKTINPFEFLTTLRVPAKPCGATTTSDDVTECGWIMAPRAFQQTS